MVLAFAAGASAKSRKGEKIWKQGKEAEDRREFDKALDLYEKALNEDPANPSFLLSVRKIRFQAGQSHVDKGKKLRAEGKLDEALLEFQRGFAIDPSSSIAEQEIRRTSQMIEREKKRAAEPGQAGVQPQDRGLTPAQQARKENEERVASALPPPELRPITPQISTLKMNNQPVKVLFETVGKLAGINVVFDPEYQSQPGKNFGVDLVNVTLDEALDYLAVITKSFWKPLASNTVFVTNDSVAKRRDYEDFVVKVFYLQNVTTVQELQEIATNVRSVADIRRLFTYNSQNAIVVRDTADKVMLAEKLIQDLDKPKPEVIIDIIVMEANRSRTRSLASMIARGTEAGISTPIQFTPRNPVLSGTTTTPASSSTSDTGSLINSVTPTATAATSSAISLAQIGRVSTNDYSLTLPGAFIQALMSDRTTRVLQSPQLRAADGNKTTLKIGDRYPYATGSFGSGMGAVGVGISPLVSTQFQFAEVGVNADITPRIHGSNEVSLHVELEISSVRDNIDVGGLKQPIIGQRRMIHDLRVKEGEVSVLGGLMKGDELKSMSGVPGVSNVPLLKRLFSNENVERNASELLVVLIPHIVRSSEVNDVNMRGVAAGNDQVVKLNLAPRRPAPQATPPAPVAPPAAPTPAPVPAEPKPAAAPAGASLTFAPAALEAKAGSNFTATLQANGMSDLYAAAMRVKFDPKALKLVGVERGGLMAMDGQQPLFTRNIQEDAGEVAISITRLPGAGGVSGSGVLATLTFQAVGRGATEITFADLSVRNSQMQPLAAAPPKLAVNIQ